jgi:hypothetical protein
MRRPESRVIEAIAKAISDPLQKVFLMRVSQITIVSRITQ